MLGNLVSLNRLLPWVPRFKLAAPPTVFHVTHYKAGSQWIHRLFQELVPDRIVAPDAFHHHFLDQPVVPGKVYPTLYLTSEQFQSVALPENHRTFVMIRDLRDTLVSLYFSQLKSHQILHKQMEVKRETLAAISPENGLLSTFNDLMFVAQVQWSWVSARVPLLKYEELLRNDEELLADVLLRRCRLGVNPRRFREVVRANRFEAFSGRKPGEEDVNSHQRKGVAGDWKNHFTPRVIDVFKRRYGSVLIATGYEKDFNW